MINRNNRQIHRKQNKTFQEIQINCALLRMCPVGWFNVSLNEMNIANFWPLPEIFDSNQANQTQYKMVIAGESNKPNQIVLLHRKIVSLVEFVFDQAQNHVHATHQPAYTANCNYKNPAETDVGR